MTKKQQQKIFYYTKRIVEQKLLSIPSQKIQQIAFKLCTISVENYTAKI